MFVLVRVTVVVGETDLTHDAVPLSAFEQIAGPLGTSCLGRGLAHDDHRLVRRRRVIRRFLAEPRLVALVELFRAGPVHVTGPLSAGEDIVGDVLLLGEGYGGETGSRSEKRLRLQVDLGRLDAEEDGVSGIR